MSAKKCCKMGTYECQTPMPISGRVRYIDRCIADVVAALNAAGIETVASCCGHKEIDAEISLKDGRVVVVYDWGDSKKGE